MNNPAQFDRATLSAVKPGVDATLCELNAQLERFLENPVAEIASLTRAQSELHRLLGVFKMIRLDGVAIFCAELDTVFSELAVTPQMTSALHREELRAALNALARYLDDLAQGADNTTLRLFANYQQMQQLRGLEMSFELDLFFPNLAVPLPSGILSLTRFPDPVAYFKAARNYYQQGLLRYLRQEDTIGALKLMQQAVNVAMTSMPPDQSRAFWWVCSGLIDCVSRDGLPPDLSAQKLFGRIDQQMRAVIAGNAGNIQSLLNEMLYLVGRSHNVSEIVASIKRTYALDRYFPESTTLSPAELAKRLGVIRELLRSTEEQWELCVNGDQGACTSFVTQAKLISQQNEKLDLNALQYLAQQIVKFSLTTSHSENIPKLGLDMAIALLLLGSGITHYRELDSSFQEQVRLLSERMQAEIDGQPLEGSQLSTLVALYCQTERNDALFLLSKEMLINLQQVENGLNGLFNDVTKRDELGNVQRWLKQVQGSLQVSGLSHATQLIEAIQQTIQLFIESDKPIKPTDSRAVAGALSQLEGYLQQLSNGHQDQVEGLLAATHELQQVRQPAPPVSIKTEMPAAPQARSGEDQELLEIFLEEAVEVLGIMRASLEICQIAPTDHDALVTIRRGFHTLKGSGRMVGLVEIGEVAWAAESAMNKWLQSNKPALAQVLNFIEQAIQHFAVWVEELGSRGYAQIEAEGLVKLAQRVEAVALGNPDITEETVVDSTAVVPPIVEMAVAPAPTPAETVQLQAELPVMSVDTTPRNSDQLHIGDRTLSMTLFKIGSDEARQHVSALRRCLEELKTTPSLLVQYDFMRAAHTLAGVNRAMGFAGVVELASALEGWLHARIETPSVLYATELPLLEQVIGALEEMTRSICNQQAPAKQSDLAQALRTHREVIVAVNEPEEVVSTPDASISEPMAVFIEQAPAEIKATTIELETTVQAVPVEEDAFASFFDAPSTPVDTPSIALEPVSAPDMAMLFEPAAPAHVAPVTEDTFASFFDVPSTPVDPPSIALEPVVSAPDMAMLFEPAAPAHVAPATEDTFASLFDTPSAPIEPQVLALEPVASTPDVATLFELAVPVQTLPVVEEVFAQAPLPVDACPIDFESAFDIAPLLESAATPVVPVQALAKPVVEARRDTLPEEAIAVPKSSVVQVRDDVDEQLLPMFLEEADDLVPKMGACLRAWRDAPNDEQQSNLLKRLLHTIKGSSRMVGAMRIGEIAHDMESRVIAVAKLHQQAGYWDGLEHEFDRISALLEELRSGTVSPLEVLAADTVLEVETENEDTPLQASNKDNRRITERAALGGMLRVRADVIDRLVNEAGEISVTRSRMETELRVFKEALMELTGSVNRLRQQLREVEIQAESQMQARITLSQTDNEQFDPLEFDRFTRLQELTRFMNESVHDVQTVQQTLLKNLDETTAAMSAQARLNRDLQQRLMNVRMVPFDSIADRLYRIVRQTGKDLKKRANLELQGGHVELDRSVLEKMTAPFEHLLRNAIAHGLEGEARRIQDNKAPIGDIRLTLRQENNEVVFELSDDGGGLNFTALRDKAITLGFAKTGDVLSEQQLAQLIFVSGISTATEISAVAGRGIGMDVVRSEIAGLGGRIDVSSTAGVGTRFTIHLPLTLAVMQTVMVRSGESIFAIPATMVEQVIQVKTVEMAALHQARQVEAQGRTYPLHYLPTLLGDESHVAENQVRNSLLLLRSAEQRIALHVDELMGRHEAVVKNIGPQLARLIGVAGATVRGDGAVVLILNPVQMAQRVSTVVHKAAVAIPEVLRTQRVIMVVDDSLTVRKITTRLLTRAGYQVVTATDGVNALEQLSDITPDVMLLDVEMPRMDGFELTKNIRRNQKMTQFPIIMITSRTANKHRDYAMQLGVNVYLGKPYQEDELLRHIAAFIGTTAAA